MFQTGDPLVHDRKGFVYLPTVLLLCADLTDLTFHSWRDILLALAFSDTTSGWNGLPQCSVVGHEIPEGQVTDRRKLSNSLPLPCDLRIL